MSRMSWSDSFELPLPPAYPGILLAIGEMIPTTSGATSFHVCLCLICETACTVMPNLAAIFSYSSVDVRIVTTSALDRLDLPRPPVSKQSWELSPRLPRYRCFGQMQCRSLTHSRLCSTLIPLGIGPINSWYDRICARCILPSTYSSPYPFHESVSVHSQCPSTLSMLDNNLSNSSMVLLYYGV